MQERWKEKQKMPCSLSTLLKYALTNISLGIDCHIIDFTKNIYKKIKDEHFIVAILYVYGYNYLCYQCVYGVAMNGLLANVVSFYYNIVWLLIYVGSINI